MLAMSSEQDALLVAMVNLYSARPITDGPNCDDERDRDSLVPARLRTKPSGNTSAIALPEPDNEAPQD